MLKLQSLLVQIRREARLLRYMPWHSKTNLLIQSLLMKIRREKDVLLTRVSEESCWSGQVKLDAKYRYFLPLQGGINIGSATISLLQGGQLAQIPHGTLQNYRPKRFKYRFDTDNNPTVILGMFSYLHNNYPDLPWSVHIKPSTHCLSGKLQWSLPDRNVAMLAKLSCQ